MRVAWIVVLAACTPIPPPPVVPIHADTSSSHPDAVTALLVFGVAGTVLGGHGYGIAARVERQQTDRTTIGAELTLGRGDEATRDRHIRHTLVAVRGYGRFVPESTDEAIALTYSAGASYFDTGLVTLSVHGGFAFSWVNDYVEPLGEAGLAVVWPLRRGRPFGKTIGDSRTGDPPRQLRPTTDVMPYFAVGVIVPIGDTGNRLSVEAASALSTRQTELIQSVSAAEAQRF